MWRLILFGYIAVKRVNLLTIGLTLNSLFREVVSLES